MKTEDSGRRHSEVRKKSRRWGGGTQKSTLRKVNIKYTKRVGTGKDV